MLFCPLLPDTKRHSYKIIHQLSRPPNHSPPHPNQRINTLSHIAVKSRKWLIGNVLAIIVFDRVVMQIIGVTVKVRLVTDLMLPKTALPECGFPMFAFGRVQPIGAAVMLPTLDTDLAFNQTPTAGKIGIAFGQRPNARQLLHALLYLLHPCSRRQLLHALQSHKDVANAENAGAVFCLPLSLGIQVECKWSGNNTHASMVNGFCSRTELIASRKATRTASSHKIGWRRKVTTVKK